MNQTAPVIPAYLDLLDAQRETVFAQLDGVSEDRLWQRPGPRKWCIGEHLNHAYLLYASFLPIVRFFWNVFDEYAECRRGRPYQTEVPDPYRVKSFPWWVGVFWTPRHTPRKPVSLEQLKTELREVHQIVRTFFTERPEDLLGHVLVFDPLFGWINLIVTLRIGIYHDQIHYDIIRELLAQS